MVGEASKKRQRKDSYRRKHDRNKFRKTTNATVHRKDLGRGLKGFLFSCTPHHENQCFRDGVLLLSKFCGDGIDDPEKGSQTRKTSLEEELNDLRSGEEKLFTRVDGGINGAVFLRINNDKIDIEHVVESALRDARQTGNPGSRHCIRLLPIYTTCYAKAEDAAKAAMGVVKEHFPQIEDSTITYAIAFRSRVNNSVKRDDFIPAIAAAVEKVEPRFMVNLTKPDVVLLVEVLKTSCCIGVFRHYYELAKMNLREAACPSKPKASERKEGSAENDNKGVKSGDAKDAIDVDHKTDSAKAPKLEDEGKSSNAVEPPQKIERESDEKTKQNSLVDKDPHKGEEVQNEGDELVMSKPDDGANGETKGLRNEQGGSENNSEVVYGNTSAQKASEATIDTKQKT